MILRDMMSETHEIERLKEALALSERKRAILMESMENIAPAYRLESKNLHELAAKTAEELKLPDPEDQGGHPFKHTPHSLILALRDKVLYGRFGNECEGMCGV
jgi:hypothetical protein